MIVKNEEWHQSHTHFKFILCTRWPWQKHTRRGGGDRDSRNTLRTERNDFKKLVCAQHRTELLKIVMAQRRLMRSYNVTARFWHRGCDDIHAQQHQNILHAWIIDEME